MMKNSVCVSRTFYGICALQKDSVVCAYGGHCTIYFYIRYLQPIPTLGLKTVYILSIIPTLGMILWLFLGLATTFETLGCLS